MALQNFPFRKKTRSDSLRPRRKPRAKWAAPHVRARQLEQGDGETLCSVPTRIVVPKVVSVERKRILEPSLTSTHPKPNKLIQFRESRRWCKESDRFLRDTVFALPFVTREGVISSNGLCYWKCSSKQWIATVSATVYQRIVGRWRRWTVEGDRVVPNRDLALRVAVMYALTFDSGRLCRILECAKRNEFSARKMLYKWSRNVDAPIRFWYGQLCSLGTGSWLQHRGQRPRDKSTNFMSDFRMIEVNLDDSKIRENCMWLNSLTDPWIRKVSSTNNYVSLRKNAY